MKKEKGNFEFVKEEEDGKRNYIFQKDSITTKGFFFVAIVLVLLIVAVVLTSIYLG